MKKSEIKIIQSKILNVKTGTNVTIIQPSNIYGCSLDDDVSIGPFVEIQKNVSIGKLQLEIIALLGMVFVL
jgi:bifunctional N-acetylglucosamine-1-phosphate-uridyltransferase/glucosamine-1-phosphate-acetyltransferase GlmU-like protein